MKLSYNQAVTLFRTFYRYAAGHAREIIENVLNHPKLARMYDFREFKKDLLDKMIEDNVIPNDYLLKSLLQINAYCPLCTFSWEQKAENETLCTHCPIQFYPSYEEENCKPFCRIIEIYLRSIVNMILDQPDIQRINDGKIIVTDAVVTPLQHILYAIANLPERTDTTYTKEETIQYFRTMYSYAANHIDEILEVCKNDPRSRRSTRACYAFKYYPSCWDIQRITIQKMRDEGLITKEYIESIKPHGKCVLCKYDDEYQAHNPEHGEDCEHCPVRFSNTIGGCVDYEDRIDEIMHSYFSYIYETHQTESDTLNNYRDRLRNILQEIAELPER